VAWSVSVYMCGCWSQLRAVQKRLHWSRCRSGCGLGWTQATMCRAGFYVFISLFVLHKHSLICISLCRNCNKHIILQWHTRGSFSFIFIVVCTIIMLPVLFRSDGTKLGSLRPYSIWSNLDSVSQWIRSQTRYPTKSGRASLVEFGLKLTIPATVDR